MGELPALVPDQAKSNGALIEGAYVRDVLAQPDTLRTIRQSLAELDLAAGLFAEWRAGRFKRVVLTGMGSSLFAAYPLHRALSGAGIVSHWIETAELLLGFAPLYSPDTLLVVISQSGESAEIVSLSQRAGAFGHLVAITNNAQSPLGRAAGSRILLNAGEEFTVSCKTYLNTLAALHWLSAQLLRGDASAALEELEQAEHGVRDYLRHWREHVAEVSPLLDGIQDVFVTGRGDALATTSTGGLILKESTRRHAEGMSAAAFRHGPIEMAGESVLILIFEGEEGVAPLNRRLAQDILSGGGKSALIGPRTAGLNAFCLPNVPASVQPLVEILPVQMLSLALGMRGGFEAGRFTRSSKITAIA